MRRLHLTQVPRLHGEYLFGRACRNFIPIDAELLNPPSIARNRCRSSHRQWVRADLKPPKSGLWYSARGPVFFLLRLYVTEPNLCARFEELGVSSDSNSAHS